MSIRESRGVYFQYRTELYDGFVERSEKKKKKKCSSSTEGKENGLATKSILAAELYETRSKRYMELQKLARRSGSLIFL